MRVREVLKTYDYNVIGIDVNPRGKSYIDISLLPRASFPGVGFLTPFFIYDGRVYIPPEYATGLVQPRHDVDPSSSVHPTLSTIIVTTARHGITRTFSCDFKCWFNSTCGEPSWQRYRSECTMIKKKAMIDIFRFFDLATASHWCAEVFGTWKLGKVPTPWKNAIYSAEVPAIVEDWRDISFCTPDGIFTGVKPGNTLSSMEEYRYIKSVKNKQGKVRSDKVILPGDDNNLGKLIGVRLAKQSDGTIVIRYDHGYTYRQVEGKNELIFTYGK